MLFNADCLENLKRRQPRLHRELIESVYRLQYVKQALVVLPEPFEFDGALSEIFALVDAAVLEVRGAPSSTQGGLIIR